MKLSFCRIRAEEKKDCIRIQSNIKYNTLSVINSETPLINSNKFIIAKGLKLFDIVQFDDSLNFSISKKVKNILETNHVTGWSCFPIVIEGINEEYFAFQILSKAGPILNIEAVNNYETENREFDIKTWDGSDIFNLEGTLLIVITPRVKVLLEKAKVSNLEIHSL